MKKQLSMLFILILLIPCYGCKWMPSALKTYQMEYDELANEPEATTADDAKKQYEKDDEFVGRLRAENQDDLPDGLLAKAIALDTKRLAHCGSLAAQEKASGLWKWFKKKLHSDGVSPEEAAKSEPALAEPLKVTTTTTSTTTDGTARTAARVPNDNRSDFQ